ncbi:zf-HC2 domain-containing protein [Streptomyces sp. NPDC048248]|uniref:zf-HC2 domain-containing protein n=1 Tax=Streptomyces sp. NPDC048248 TaxID=3365523 RepID=UPI0037245064
MSDDFAMSEESAVDAYTALHAREYPHLIGYARLRTADPALAADLVAEAHFHVWQRIHGGARIEDIRAYLRTTIRDLAATAEADPARRIPRDPQDDPRAGTRASAEGAEASEPGGYVDLLARILNQLPQRWVQALWLAEAENQSPGAIAKTVGGKEDTAAVLLNRARGGLRQAFLSEIPGAPEDPLCFAYRERMPAVIRGEATGDQVREVEGHLPHCPDCQDRMALLTRSDDRLSALIGPALLTFLAGDSATFLRPLVGVGAAGTGANTGSPEPTPSPMRRLLRGRVGMTGPVAATAAGVAAAAVAGAAVAAGFVLAGDDSAAAPHQVEAASRTTGGTSEQSLPQGGAPTEEAPSGTGGASSTSPAAGSTAPSSSGIPAPGTTGASTPGQPVPPRTAASISAPPSSSLPGTGPASGTPAPSMSAPPTTGSPTPGTPTPPPTTGSPTQPSGPPPSSPAPSSPAPSSPAPSSPGPASPPPSSPGTGPPSPTAEPSSGSPSSSTTAPGTTPPPSDSSAPSSEPGTSSASAQPTEPTPTPTEREHRDR